MFAFIDESGHTGDNISDPVQPILFYMGILANKNIGVLENERIAALCRDNNIDRLHASELGPKNEQFAGAVERIIKAYSPQFVIAEVQKTFFAVAKLFDTLFDSGENLGARNHVYNIRALRLLLLSNFSLIADERIAFYFYNNCLLAESQEKANVALISTCEELASRASSSFDDRTKKLLMDTLTWAIKNPEAITTYNSAREQRWRHLPNVAAFVPTMQEMAIYARKNRTKVRKIIHDEQIQLEKILKEAHSFSSNLNAPDTVEFGDNPPILFKELKNSKFEMASSKTNVGLQLVDFLLYNWKKREYLKENMFRNPNSISLINYYAPRSRFFFMSFEQLHEECGEIIRRISKEPLTEDQIFGAKEMIARIEIRYKNMT